MFNNRKKHKFKTYGIKEVIIHCVAKSECYFKKQIEEKGGGGQWQI